MKRLFTFCMLILSLVFLSQGSAQTVTFGFVEWPELTVKTEVAATVLEAIGYDTGALSLSLPLVLRGVSTGDLDVFLGLWMPSMTGMIEPYFEDGTITQVGVILDETIYRPAVPSYVYDAGVQSLADLNEHAERFGAQIYGIEPGNDGNELVFQMIEENIYDLSGWTLVESSTEGMLAAVRNAINRNNWIVFLGWSPHWMNTEFDMTYLDDPENIWGEDGYVGVIMNSAYAESHPNLARFFSQFKVDADTMSTWTEEFSLQGLEPSAIANTWIPANMDVVLAWLEGVTATDGRPAGDVLREAFGQ
jgi:glycine betaine/proline transport system substrate-binding protein